jgi:hypothetical protein
MRKFVTAATVLVVLGVFASCAWAGEGVGWEAFTQVYPSYLHPGGKGTIQINLMNTGAKGSSGAITVTDRLPNGVTATAAGGIANELGVRGTRVESKVEEEKEFGGPRWDCEGIGTEVVTCTSNPAYLMPLPEQPKNRQGEPVSNSEPVQRIAVEVSVGEGVLGSFSNDVSIAGGGAPTASVTNVSNELTVSTSEPSGFGFSGWDVWFTNADGSIDTQAGSHPYETTFAVGYDELADAQIAGGEVKDLEVELPPGFFGEPNSAPRCTRAQLDAAECPADTDIGQNLAMTNNEENAGGGGSAGAYDASVFNMVPPRGVVDQFAVDILGHNVFFDTGPRGYGNYNLITRIYNIPQGVKLDGNILILWGVASEVSHNGGRSSLNPAENCQFGCASGAPPRPFLTLPTSCEGPQPFTIHDVGTWSDEGARSEASIQSHDALGDPTGFAGCSSLAFEPSLAAAPDTSQADTPAGLDVTVAFPQEALRTPGVFTEATNKDTTVTLPEGFVINPGQAAGLQACSTAQAKLGEEGAPACPSASKVGTVKIQTPLLEGELESELVGDAYVLEQSRGLPGEPPNLSSETPALQLLIAASGDGVNLKLVANVQLNKTTGRLTTTLTRTPGVAFTKFELAFSGGPQAALATPAECGTYTTTSDFTPWTTPAGADRFPTSAFQLTSGPGGGACPSSPLPFSPSLIAGSTTDQAGGFTDFSLLLQRGDGQQRIERLQFKVPEGLSGMISDVELCPEPQASKGECSPASQIGHAAVASGPGAYPLVIPQPGNPESQIYLTGPYKGAPFGLTIVTHVIAGPFNLGTVITRAKIEVDPLTAQITVTTEPFPQIVDGVPTDLRLIDSVIDRPGFMFNPTNCEPMSFSGTAWGTPPPGVGGPGATAAISSHFQVGSCRSLTFKPDFTVKTSGKTSRADGASLTAKIVYPKGPFPDNQASDQANIKSVKVDLPKQLPSRLTTLQKACTAAQFESNPAGCPAASRVGTATALTPLLPVTLTGPAYFVSYGGAKFPELVIVLQGENVTVDLHGETFISKAGITSSTFHQVPDVPVTVFELTLPQGPDSALAANGNLCKAKLLMPTAFTGQNSATIHQNTKIAVSGCPKTKKTKKTKKTRHKPKRHK